MRVFENKVDFYITNVCNLTCEHCNRFNNHDFRGWQRWSDYESIYARWSELISLRAVTIMGGEPFLNASLPDWVAGINRFFGIEVQILTNGTRFRNTSGLYETMLYRSPRTGQQNHIGVSLHNPEEFDRLVDDIYFFLGSGVTMLPKGQNIWNSDWQFVDSRGVSVNVYTVVDFGQSAILPRREKDGVRYALHNSNPDIAHQNCAFARWKSYHFVRGKLYKCGPVALLPEFDQQFGFDISDQDRELLHGYRPLTVDNFHTEQEDFFAALDSVIPQCKFCSESPDRHKIFPIRKGRADSV